MEVESCRALGRVPLLCRIWEGHPRADNRAARFNDDYEGGWETILDVMGMATPMRCPRLLGDWCVDEGGRELSVVNGAVGAACGATPLHILLHGSVGFGVFVAAVHVGGRTISSPVSDK